MVISASTHLFLLFSLLSLFIATTTATTAATTITSADSNSDLQTLKTLQSQSESGVIHLTDDLISRLITTNKYPRTFSLLIFFDAAHLHNNSKYHLKYLRSEFFQLASKLNKINELLFLCEIEFNESQSSFALFGVNTLPHIRLVDPYLNNLKEAGNFSRAAEESSDRMSQPFLSRL